MRFGRPTPKLTTTGEPGASCEQCGCSETEAPSAGKSWRAPRPVRFRILIGVAGTLPPLTSCSRSGLTKPGTAILVGCVPRSRPWSVRCAFNGGSRWLAQRPPLPAPWLDQRPRHPHDLADGLRVGRSRLRRHRRVVACRVPSPPAPDRVLRDAPAVRAYDVTPARPSRRASGVAGRGSTRRSEDNGRADPGSRVQAPMYRTLGSLFACSGRVVPRSCRTRLGGERRCGWCQPATMCSFPSLAQRGWQTMTSASGRARWAGGAAATRRAGQG